MRRTPGPKSPPLTGPQFKVVFAFIAAVTVLAGVAYVALALLLRANIDDTQKEALGFAKMISQTGFGTVIGLLGGKIVK